MKNRPILLASNFEERKTANEGCFSRLRWVDRMKPEEWFSVWTQYSVNEVILLLNPPRVRWGQYDPAESVNSIFLKIYVLGNLLDPMYFSLFIPDDSREARDHHQSELWTCEGRMGVDMTLCYTNRVAIFYLDSWFRDSNSIYCQ